MSAPDPEPKASGSEIRDHLANQRTFLAWVRTAITFIGLGFAVDELLVEDRIGQLLGVAMMLAGAGMMLPALRSYRQTADGIRTGRYAPPLHLSTLLTVGVVAGAALLVAFALLRGR